MASEADDDRMYRLPFPLEVVIGQTPLSAQARSQAREDWKRLVGDLAKKKIEEQRELYYLDQRPLAVTVYYFSPSQNTPDVDNIVKPILDGMKSIAYFDDSCVERIVAQKFEPGISWLFHSPSPSLQAAIDMEKPAVYIRLEDNLMWREVRYER